MAAAAPSDPLLAWRSEFPILERKAGYLINNSLGAMPRKVHEHLKAYADTWATEGGTLKNSCNWKPNQLATRWLGNDSHLFR